MNETASTKTSRREFLKNTTKIAAASGVAGPIGSRIYAAENNTIKIALVGCGGRGTGASGRGRTQAGRGTRGMGHRGVDRARDAARDLHRHAHAHFRAAGDGRRLRVAGAGSARGCRASHRRPAQCPSSQAGPAKVSTGTAFFLALTLCQTRRKSQSRYCFFC